MTAVETIAVVFAAENGKATLTVEEFQPLDPAAYQWEAGWTCFSEAGREFFISQTGDVWAQPQNVVVGYAPEIRAQCERDERMWQEWEDSEY